MLDLRKQRIEDRGQRTDKRARRAVTLIELLVVVSIMMMLAAFALPKLGPMAKQRKIREASRSVSVFLSRARSRAIETGRPCGVVFHRVSDDNTNPLSKAVSMLYQAEVPPPYAGNTSGAAMKLLQHAGANDTVYLQAQIQATSLSNGLVRRGDRIQLNGQGPWYEIIARPLALPPYTDLVLDGNDFIKFVDSTYTVNPTTGLITSHFLTLRWVGSPGCVSPWPAGSPSAPVPFKILRQPVRTIAQPLTLPVGTTVDLSASGTSQNAMLFYTGKNDVTIMFSPNGSVGRYYWDDGVAPYNVDATDPIYLLIGWREQVGGPGAITQWPDLSTTDTPDEETLANWQVLTNLWVTLIPQSGLVSTSDMSHSDKAYNDVKQPPLDAQPYETRTSYMINASRQYARQASMKGGR